MPKFLPGGEWRGNRFGRPRLSLLDKLDRPAPPPPPPPTAKEIARANGVAALRVIIAIMNDATAPTSARLAAADIVLDRALGKPAAHVEAKVRVFDTMSNEQLIAFIIGGTVEYSADDDHNAD